MDDYAGDFLSSSVSSPQTSSRQSSSSHNERFNIRPSAEDIAYEDIEGQLIDQSNEEQEVVSEIAAAKEGALRRRVFFEDSHQDLKEVDEESIHSEWEHPTIANLTRTEDQEIRVFLDAPKTTAHSVAAAASAVSTGICNASTATDNNLVEPSPTNLLQNISII